MKYKSLLILSIVSLSTCLLSSCREEISIEKLNHIIATYDIPSSLTGTLKESGTYSGNGELYEEKKDEAYDYLIDISKTVSIYDFYDDDKIKYSAFFQAYLENKHVSYRAYFYSEDASYTIEENVYREFDEEGIALYSRITKQYKSKTNTEKMIFTINQEYSWNKNA